MERRIRAGATLRVTVELYICRPHTRDNSLITGDGMQICLLFSNNGGYVVFKYPIAVSGGR